MLPTKPNYAGQHNHSWADKGHVDLEEVYQWPLVESRARLEW